jgi:hypothetical protein
MNEEVAQALAANNAIMCQSLFMLLGIVAASHVMLFIGKNAEHIFDLLGSLSFRRTPTNKNQKKKKSTPAGYGAFYIPSEDELENASLGDDGELIYDDASTNT